MNSGHVGEKSISNHFNRVQNGKVEKEIFSDIVLVLQDESVRNHWPMARVIQVFKDSVKCKVRSVKLRIGKTRNYEGDRILERPVSKISLLVEQECVRFPDEEEQKE